MEIRSSETDDLISQIRERMHSKIKAHHSDRMSTQETGPGIDLSNLADLNRLCRENATALGRIPPGPPSLRGRTGAWLIRIVQRMLFWYTPQIVAFQDLAARTMGEQLETMRRTSALLADLEQRQIQIVRDAEALQAEADRLRGALEGLAERYEETDSKLQVIEDAQRRNDNTAELAGRTGALERAIANIRTELALQGQRTALITAEARRRLPGPLDSAQLAALSAETDHQHDALYAGFEDVFRGTREDIKDRLRVYLPYRKKTGMGPPPMPVVDLGSGRGEWLELLRNEGLEGKGVDLNRVFLEQCRNRGLNVIEADLLCFLESVPDASLGAVTGFHVLEHLPFASVIGVLDHTVRVLKPGGIAIFETPNPANLMVGANTFYFDPTHRNPLPSPVLAFFAEARGLCNVEVLPLNSPFQGQQFVDDGSELVSRLNAYLFGPQDYAVIGHKL